MDRHFPTILAWPAKSDVTVTMAPPFDNGPAIDKLAPTVPLKTAKTMAPTTTGHTTSLYNLVIVADIYAFYHMSPACTKRISASCVRRDITGHNRCTGRTVQGQEDHADQSVFIVCI